MSIIFERNRRTARRGAVLYLAAAAVIAVFSSSPVMPAIVPPDLAYFQGTWTLTIKSDAASSYTWTVTEDLKGGWLTGVVEKTGERISIDHWRVNAGVIERYAFTNDGLFIKLVSSGWKGNKMILNGIAYGKTSDYRIRETITKDSDRKFRAVWEKQGEDGKWTTISEELCVK